MLLPIAWGRELFGSGAQILFDGLNGVPGAVPHLPRGDIWGRTAPLHSVSGIVAGDLHAKGDST